MPLEIEYDIIMDATNNVKKWTREDFLALLERGRQIKARRQREAEEWYAERQRRKKEVAESGYYDLQRREGIGIRCRHYTTQQSAS